MHASNTAFEVPSPAQMVQRLLVTAACSVIIIYSGVVTETFMSTKSNKVFLYPALVLYAVFGSMWAYTVAYLQRKDLRWFESHEKFLYAATMVAVAASFLWTVGMWPVFSFWTVPLYMVMVVFLSHLVGLMPSIHAKAH